MHPRRLKARVPDIVEPAHMQSCGRIAIFFAIVFLSACGGSALAPPAPNAVPPGARISRATASGYKQLYAFAGTPDGASPFSGLIAVGGTLYGTTLNGSSNYCSQSCSNYCYLGCGTVFSITPGGSENVVYNFKGNFASAHDGSWPFAGLTKTDGRLFGTTSSAGQYGYGTVYTVTPAGKERVVYSFMGGGESDGASPEAPLVAHRGRLYGTTVSGGGTGCGGGGCGTVYWLTTTGKEFVLYHFSGGTDGDRLYAPVTIWHDRIYGATLFGGSGCGTVGCGTIFELNLHGKKRVLHDFNGTDGNFPNGLTVVHGVLYGTTEGGGSRNSGTFFSVTPSGKFTTLYSFKDNPDANGPGASLVWYGGNLYGTSVGGGTDGDGTVFKISTSGTEQVLYSFAAGTDGADPQGPVYPFHGALYGTTNQGGNGGCGGHGCGTVYTLNP